MIHEPPYPIARLARRTAFATQRFVTTVARHLFSLCASLLWAANHGFARRVDRHLRRVADFKKIVTQELLTSIAAGTVSLVIVDRSWRNRIKAPRFFFSFPAACVSLCLFFFAIDGNAQPVAALRFPIAEFPSPGAGALFQWLCCLGALVGLIGGCLWTYNQYQEAAKPEREPSTRLDGQPIRITMDQEMHEIFVGRDEFSEVKHRLEKVEHNLHSEINRVLQSGDDRKDAILAKLSQDTGNLHRRIDTFTERVINAIGELKGEMKGRFE